MIHSVTEEFGRKTEPTNDTGATINAASTAGGVRAGVTDMGAAQPQWLAPRASEALLEVQWDGKRSRVTRSAATYPARLFIPRRNELTARVYTMSYGGGMISGDKMHYGLKIGRDSKCLLTTTSANKIYKSLEGNHCEQNISAEVEKDATLVVAPHPTICYADARFDQRQTYDVHSQANLVVIDWFLSGRWKRGERWAFQRYFNRIDVTREGQPLVQDTVLLDAADGPLIQSFRGGRFNCLATAILTGPAARVQAETLPKADYPPPGAGRHGRQQTWAVSVSPFEHHDVVRVAGQHPEQVEKILKSMLSPILSSMKQVVWEA